MLANRSSAGRSALITTAAVALALLSVAAVQARQDAGAPKDALTNAGVEKLAKSGLSEDLIIGIVRTQPAAFDVGVDALVALKKAGVSDRIIEAMTAQAASGGGVPTESGGVVKVPLKTAVRLLVDKELSSGSAKAGESFPLVAAEDVVVAGKVVISKGAPAVGRVTGVQKKAFATRNGSIELEIDSVRAVDGQDLPLQGRVVEDGGAAGFGSTGKNVQVAKGRPVTAVVGAERDVASK